MYTRPLPGTFPERVGPLFAHFSDLFFVYVFAEGVDLSYRWLGEGKIRFMVRVFYFRGG